MGFTCKDYGEGLVIFVNSDYFGIFADPSHQPEWRNGRRDGLKIHCPLKACGFESRLGHGPGRFGRAFSCPWRDAAAGAAAPIIPLHPQGTGEGFPRRADALPLLSSLRDSEAFGSASLPAPAGRYYVDPSPNPFPRGRDLVGLRPPMVLFRRLRGRCSRGQKSANNVTAGRFLVSLGQKLAEIVPPGRFRVPLGQKSAENVPLSSCTSRGEGEGSPSAAAQLSPLSSLRDSEGGRFGPECGVCRPKTVKNQPIRPEKPIFRPAVVSPCALRELEDGSPAIW